MVLLEGISGTTAISHFKKRLATQFWAICSRDGKPVPYPQASEWFEIRYPEDDYLWIAGLWEPGEGDPGFCYSMVTTAASAVMAPIHDRMPAVLRAEQVPAFLEAQIPWVFRPYDGALAVTPCESPLKPTRQLRLPPGDRVGLEMKLWG